jgi:hypothetical protein
MILSDGNVTIWRESQVALSLYVENNWRSLRIVTACTSNQHNKSSVGVQGHYKTSYYSREVMWPYWDLGAVQRLWGIALVEEGIINYWKNAIVITHRVLLMIPNLQPSFIRLRIPSCSSKKTEENFEICNFTLTDLNAIKLCRSTVLLFH